VLNFETSTEKGSRMAENTKTVRERPKARSNDLLVEEVAGELLVFDACNNRAHCLNESAAAIWRHCDGVRSVTSIATHLFPKLAPSDSKRLVALGIERLRRRRLLEGSASAPAVDLSKRQLLKKVAIMAAAAGVAAPLVSTVLAPTSAYAFSCIPSGLMCSASAQCCSGLCRDLQCA
jgi:Coenzyme PQQ synthesis protein D (PqqD)